MEGKWVSQKAVRHDSYLNIKVRLEAMIPGDTELWSCEGTYKNANATEFRNLCEFQREIYLDTYFTQIPHDSPMIALN